MVIGITQDMENIFATAIARYGVDAQQDMVIEEMSELSKAILKQRRIQNNPSHTLGDIYKAENHISEEMADVLIMLTQMFIMQKNIHAVEKFVIEKTNRLADRLGISTGGNGTAEEPKVAGLDFVAVSMDGRHIEYSFDTVEDFRRECLHQTELNALPQENDPIASCDLRGVPLYVSSFGDILTILGIDQEETEDEE